MISESEEGITTLQELNIVYSDLERRCQKIEDFEDPEMTHEQLIEKFIKAQQFIAANSLFSENQSIKEILTENLKFLTLPYYIGFLFGRISKPRKEAVNQSRNYLKAYLNLVMNFNSEDEQLFPENIKRTWMKMDEKQEFNLPRDEVIANHKEKKQIENRYNQSLKIKEENDQRECAKDFIKLKIYEAVTQIKNIEEELKILKYKDQIEKDPEAKEKHEAQLQKPIPKIKVWEVKKPEQIQSELVPPPESMQKKRTDMVAQVWQQNANKPTMTLSEVAELERQNMLDRMEREKKQKEENQQDTDSDKEEVDDRQKKKARAWDDWKDDNEKGAGNRGNR